MDLLRDKVVLVSGGTQGLGEACACEAAAQGARAVVVTGRSEELGLAVADRIERAGTPALFVRVDLRDVQQARRSVRQTIQAFGRVDAVANVAGLTTRGTLLDTTPELLHEHFAVNLRAPFFVMQEAVRDMVARGQPGTIVNVITTAARGGQPYNAPYVAAKAGLAALTKNAAHAHRWDRIRINGLNIGWTDTPAEDRLQRRSHDRGDGWQAEVASELPMGRLGNPEEIAAMVAFLLADRSGVVTGSVIDWDQAVVGAFD
jgi:NAD(P)-dependent dehydrogenase (short-subunit alcohol dehydrogenase family)